MINLILLASTAIIKTRFSFPRLLGDNAKRPAYTSRRAKRQPYTVKKEFPTTSKEAVKHLLSCENGNNFYEWVFFAIFLRIIDITTLLPPGQYHIG